MKKPRHRIFDYTPRFYNPETDETVKRKRKLGFTNVRKHARRRRSPVLWLVFIMLAVYVYMKLMGIV